VCYCGVAACGLLADNLPASIRVSHHPSQHAHSGANSHADWSAPAYWHHPWRHEGRPHCHVWGAISGLGGGGYYHGTSSGIQVTIRVEFDSGSDGKPHVSNIHISMPDYPNTTIPSSKADVIAAAFLPPDATHVRDGTDSLDHSMLHIYQSNALAATFPASKFTDTHHQPVPPGTLTIEDVLPDGNQPGVLYTSLQLSQY